MHETLLYALHFSTALYSAFTKRKAVFLKMCPFYVDCHETLVTVRKKMASYVLGLTQELINLSFCCIKQNAKRHIVYLPFIL